jgi:hypothetical protein
MTPFYPDPNTLGSRIEAILAKHVRQAKVMARWNWVMMLFHAVLGLMLLNDLPQHDPGVVQDVFWAVLTATFLVLLPLRAFQLLHAEAQDGTVTVLGLSGISSFGLVRGKWVALFGHTLVLSTSVLPYLLARFYLIGSAVERELLSVVTLVLGSGLVSAAVLGFSSQAQLLVRLLTLLVPAAGAWGIHAFAHGLARDAQLGDAVMRVLGGLNLLEGVFLLGGVLSLAAYLVYVCLCLAASGLPSLPNSEITRKRQWAWRLQSLVLVATLGLCLPGGYPRQSLVLAAYAVAMLHWFLVSLDVITEDNPMPTIHSEPTSQARWFNQPGWAGGVMLSSLMWLLPTGLLGVYDFGLGGLLPSQRAGFWLFHGSTLAILLTPSCLPFFRDFTRATQWWLKQGMLLLAAGLLMLLGHSLLADQQTLLSLVSYLTPLTSWAPLLGTHVSWPTGWQAVAWIGSQLGWMVGAWAIARMNLRRRGLLP